MIAYKEWFQTIKSQIEDYRTCFNSDDLHSKCGKEVSQLAKEFGVDAIIALVFLLREHFHNMFSLGPNEATNIPSYSITATGIGVHIGIPSSEALRQFHWLISVH